jgi:hypothetical protein
MAIGRGLVHDQNEAGPPSLYPSSRLPLHARISDRRSEMDGQSRASILAAAVQFPMSRHWLRMQCRQHRERRIGQKPGRITLTRLLGSPC